MFYSRIFFRLLISSALFIMHEAAFSADNTALVIAAVPGKTICQSKEQIHGSFPIKAELCVTRGNFSHDTYQLKVGGKPILKGIDDETTNGILSDYNGEKIQLTCVPKHEAPIDVSPEKIAAIQKMMPKLSHEEAVQAATMLETVEVGRSCLVLLGNEPLIEVLVKFE